MTKKTGAKNILTWCEKQKIFGGITLQFSVENQIINAAFGA
jgi:hypothetical protein